MKVHTLDPDYPKVSDDQARERLAAFARRSRDRNGPHTAGTLADVIWPGRHWRSAQGAGGSASRVLKRLGKQWVAKGDSWGWMI